jgi:hypothetical protein
MLLQTTSYIVPKDKRAEHARLLRRFRQILLRLGCEHFEAFEQVGANWNPNQTSGRFVQIIRFHDRAAFLAHQNAEKSDAEAQQAVAEFCELINLPYQLEQGLFAVGHYISFNKAHHKHADENDGTGGEPAGPSQPETPANPA